MKQPEALSVILDIIDELTERTLAAEKRIAELESNKPEPGPPGEKGEPGERGEKGGPGHDGENGKDGAGLIEGFVNREGHLIATLSDGTTRDFGEIIGKDGRDGAAGKDGRDGFSLDDFDCQPVDERTIKMTFVRGEVAHSYELQFPVVVYRGVYSEGAEYERGDMVTWGGSLWHCDTPTKDKPGTESWTLAAKKGRDGKDARKD